MKEKPSNQVIHTKSSGWVVRKSGSTRASKTFANKKAAIHYGEALSQTEKTNLYIHGRDGRIEERKSFSEEIESSNSG